MGYLPQGPEPDEGDFLCTVCARTYADRKTCPVHAEEPLLDTRIDEVVIRLQEEDDRNRRKSIGRWTAVTAVPAVALFFAIAIFADLDGYGGGGLLFVLLGGAAGLGVALGNRFFKPRYVRWTKRLEPKPELSGD